MSEAKKKNEEAETFKLKEAVEKYSDPEFIGGADFFTQGHCEDFFRGILAASLIDRNPELVLALRDFLRKENSSRRGWSKMLEILDGDDPVNRLLIILRSRGGGGQVVRQGFPWYALDGNETWDPADKMGKAIAGKGWCQIKELGGPELDQKNW